MIVGYTQGTFDLFHIGHLNLLKEAKKQCDYLIVGVNSDKLVEDYKNKKPIISEDDRIAIVESLKMVDKAVKCCTLDKIDAWNKNHFNYVFIGSDWKNSLRWKQTEKDLAKVNARVIYLPYTQGISSTQIKEQVVKIDEN